MTDPARGRFIVLEGGEGVGKSTQARRLSEWMLEAGIPHVLTREPGGTPVGEAIRGVVLGRTDLDVPAETELFLILGARAAFVRDVVRPALDRGEVVLADRFSLSTLAYQAHGRGLPLDQVRRADALARGGLEPDLYLLLDLDVEEGTDRQAEQGKAPDRMEGSGSEFLGRVRAGYLALSASEPRVEVIDARGAPQVVTRRLLEALARAFPETFGGPAV